MSDKPFQPTSPYTYQVELATHYHGQSDKLGATDFRSFAKSFDDFPWNEQVETADRLGRVSPTLTVNDNARKQALWVSAMREGNGITFLLGHIYKKEVSRFFGLGQPRMRNWVEIYVVNDRDVVQDCYRLFFDGNTAGLISKYRQLEKFDEMESQIQD